MPDRPYLPGPCRIRNDAACFVVGQTELQRVLPEQCEQRDGDLSRLERCQMCDRGLLGLLQQDRQPVATAEAVRAKDVRETIGLRRK